MLFYITLSGALTPCTMDEQTTSGALNSDSWFHRHVVPHVGQGRTHDIVLPLANGQTISISQAHAARLSRDVSCAEQRWFDYCNALGFLWPRSNSLLPDVSQIIRAANHNLREVETNSISVGVVPRDWLRTACQANATVVGNVALSYLTESLRICNQVRDDGVLCLLPRSVGQALC